MDMNTARHVGQPEQPADKETAKSRVKLSSAQGRALQAIVNACAASPLGNFYPLTALSAEMEHGPATIDALVDAGAVEIYRTTDGYRRIRPTAAVSS